MYVGNHHYGTVAARGPPAPTVVRSPGAPPAGSRGGGMHRSAALVQPVLGWPADLLSRFGRLSALELSGPVLQRSGAPSAPVSGARSSTRDATYR